MSSRWITEYQQKFGFTGVVVSHEIPEILYISQRLIMLHKGNIIFEGGLNELLNESNPVVMQFIRGSGSRHDKCANFLPVNIAQ